MGSSCLVQGGCLPGLGGYLPAPGGVLVRSSPVVNRITDRCKNITLAKNSFRPVTTEQCIRILCADVVSFEQNRFFWLTNLNITVKNRWLNPYRAGQIFPILRCVPSVTKVTLLHFIHTLPSVTKVSATIVLRKFCNFACIFNIVKLL